MVFLNTARPVPGGKPSFMSAGLNVASLLTEATKQLTNTLCLDDTLLFLSSKQIDVSLGVYQMEESLYTVAEICTLYTRILSCMGHVGWSLAVGPADETATVGGMLSFYGEGAGGCR